ncbi:MAG: 2-amino-4-hydroxy-6-hydroxymethyldihydropteridine diphosphokinase [Chloroflexi bacterium]|nr:2-amino-4-hydroxy-6-hydroxymethyldihydropteridine diphosphokinase [Chloroflexota bacterium]MCI0830052.1 2-amino-4-hydroxy-6-hydroxymethyldihydropteridine diphosphokinase [Chloroflexota bacterium]MCI0848367.1 2-amino-4-hydroxy-6-hydroxymethyldihydropteridine diphosphokinase [Chloroflexota bacterium]MCI0899378.1 2-amino-4-hydroxy-6-hydroxymethyldihydropteridine diphosphokinase [Chloroflexota bacterium]
MNEKTAYLGLGTNLGDREQNLVQAVNALNAGPELAVLRTSGIYETAPWGLTNQPDFLNTAAEISTTLSPRQLLDRIKDLEHQLGREAGPRFGPRLIDIDILLFGDLVVDEPDLRIPHASLHLRAFALVPLAELTPDSVHPILGITIAKLAGQVDGLEGVKPLVQS